MQEKLREAKNRFLNAKEKYSETREKYNSTRLEFQEAKEKLAKKNLDKIARVKYVNNGVNSMETFYRKRMWKEYPLILNLLVVFGIRVIKVIRFMIILIK